MIPRNIIISPILALLVLSLYCAEYSQLGSRTTTTTYALDLNNNNNVNRQKNYKFSRQFADKLDLIRGEALSASNNLELSEDGFNNGINNNNNKADNSGGSKAIPSPIGRLEELKQEEAELARKLADVRCEKLSALRAKPLTIGVVGFGRFGQFIAKTLSKHGKIVVTSRSDYTDVANDMGADYVPLSDPQSFLDQNLDVIIVATSIVSFDSTIKTLAPQLEEYISKSKTNKGPLIVDVLSVKEHARDILLEQLPKECDILCTHPMFGPDSGKNGWHNLNFVYEKTRVDQLYSYTEAMDRIERFLSIWEEEGCRMVPLSCKSHDEYAANSQFITHLMGRILGAQGLSKTPIDTKGFESVLKLIDSTTADSFDLFYGLYKFNKKNAMSIIQQLQGAMEDVVDNLQILEEEELKEEQLQNTIKEIKLQNAEINGSQEIMIE
ncbi:arogenate dehydrogenase [Fragilariopsis cylindrus CCMP1102]|uniref:Arogenate dehydrogenase n=1 Tax=Fragilariopsis cylindrus CCMP1102 TaxID=635003 RepID=A0A1E7F353_9STRA|nr:arogenate dehydrogenase [Fragilariopsis cylindrus CCMP1102]|eukprot:OEU12435.1 arogenate dehydrogenase [Fragilariopsis cylindrus CCMP1102]